MAKVGIVNHRHEGKTRDKRIAELRIRVTLKGPQIPLLPHQQNDPRKAHLSRLTALHQRTHFRRRRQIEQKSEVHRSRLPQQHQTQFLQSEVSE